MPQPLCATAAALVPPPGCSSPTHVSPLYPIRPAVLAHAPALQFLHASVLELAPASETALSVVLDWLQVGSPPPLDISSCTFPACWVVWRSFFVFLCGSVLLPGQQVRGVPRSYIFATAPPRRSGAPSRKIFTLSFSLTLRSPRGSH